MEIFIQIITCLCSVIAALISVLVYLNQRKEFKRCPSCGQKTLIERPANPNERLNGVRTDTISYCINIQCANSYHNKYSHKIFGDD